ncbi:Imm52 family immunity protein [Roseateles sp. YR242]|uniref:Imm52 family immunity protein n=1 Tax=Roseateles sp. YR242 TaxID=1855305 RepID=UPI001160CDC0|nr:Imm52 family immunity protein [Roseateles sp. YR242]
MQFRWAGKLQKSNRRDVGGDDIAELGFDFTAWNGRVGETAESVSITCGAYSPVIRNCAVLSFDVAAKKPTVELLERIMKAAVMAFDPDDAVVSSTDILAAHPGVMAWQAPAIPCYTRKC